MTLSCSSLSAGYRKWEKAAIDGVSLVADAAEHLERTSIDKDMDDQKGLLASIG